MKNIVVTGGNRGIGFEISRQLTELGHRVFLASRNLENGIQSAEKLKGFSGEVIPIELDIANEESIKTFSELLAKKTNTIDVLVNNAAILNDSKYSIRNVPEQIFSEMLNTNFMGAFRLTKAMLPFLDQSNDPRIINISSGMGAFDSLSGGYPAYRLSKTLMNGFTALLSAEEPRIKVNSVCPGWVKTDMGGAGASRQVSKGAETPVWLATTQQIPTGKFLRDKKVISW